MGDENKTLDAADASAPEEDVTTSEADVTIASEETAASAADEASSLRLATNEAAEGDDLIGAPETSGTLADSDAFGAQETPPRKKGLAGLFGGGKDLDGVEANEEAAGWAMPNSATHRQGSGIRIVNRVLAAAVVLILVFGVLDLFATIRQSPGDVPLLDRRTEIGNTPASPGRGSDEGLPELANLLESFSKRPIVRDLERGGGETSVQVVTTRTQVPDWKVQAQKLDLIGLSGASNGEMEAIVADREAGRMYFLRVGQEVVAGETPLKVIRIAEDHIVFSKDGEEMTVK